MRRANRTDFTSGLLGLAFETILEYRSQHGAPPTPEALGRKLIDEGSHARVAEIESTVAMMTRLQDEEVTPSGVVEAIDRLIRHRMETTIKTRVAKVLELLQQNRVMQARDELLRLDGLQRDDHPFRTVDVRTDMARIEAYMVTITDLVASQVFKTPLEPLDTTLDGGLRRGEFACWFAVTGTGKSIALQDQAALSALAGHRVCLVTNELSAEQTAMRLYSRISGIPYQSFRRGTLNEMDRVRWQETVERLSSRQLIVLQTSDGTPMTGIEGEMARYGEFDMVIVDYAGRVAPSRGQYESSSSWSAMVQVAKDLKGFALRHNVPVWSAFQISPNAVEKDRLSLKDIAMSRLVTTELDAAVALIQTPEMRNRGEMSMQMLKVRDASYSSEPQPIQPDLNRITLRAHR